MIQISNRDNKRIAKNTIFLFIRMIMATAVGIYTSRIVLQALGETDFGIYNVVCGVVLMLNSLNMSLVASTQRFIVISVGEKSDEKAKKTFAASRQIHLALALVIVLLAETIGLWFTNTQLNIPEERMFAANIIYQLSIVSMFFSINQAPYQAVIISQERMDVFAYFSIVDVVAKLFLAYYLLITPYDSLIIYGITLSGVGITMYIIHRLFCRFKFPICKSIVRVEDKMIYKSMLSFSSWTIIGNLAFTLSNQGINILLNIFLGPAVNAARGLAVSISNYVLAFVTNFTVAVNPQITKTYASKEYESMFDLIVKSSKFSVFLLSYLAFPVIFEANFILSMWLNEVPRYTTIFSQIIIWESFLYCLQLPMSIACNAIGCVKEINLTAGMIYILGFLLSLLLLYIKPYALIPFVIHFICVFIAIVFFLYYLHKYINADIVYYIKKVLFKCVKTLLLPFVGLLAIHYYMQEGWFRLVVTLLVSTLTLSVFIATFGLETNERKKIVEVVLKKIRRKGGK